MKSFHRILFSLTVGCAAILGLTPEVRGGESIILNNNGDRSAYIRTNHQLNIDNYDYSVQNLVDGKPETFYCSGLDDAWNEGAYVEIDVNADLLAPTFKDAHLIVYVRRSPDDWDGSHRNLIDVAPTTFKVVGHFEGDNDDNDNENWRELFYTYLLYRGPSTEEYSCRISIPKLWRKASTNPDAHSPEDMEKEPGAWSGDNYRQLKKMRFYVTANHNRDKQENDFRAMSMAEFDVIKIVVDENYAPGLIDRFHRVDDYKHDYEGLAFINTRGIVDTHNSVAGWADLTALERDTVKNATKTAARPDGIDIPSFELLTPETSEYKLNEGQTRQATHTVEHILYAIPGDAIALYPYYSLHKQGEYQENFSHWYDYRTGGRLEYTAPWSEIKYDLLDFIIDPSRIQKTEDYGFYGGSPMTGNGSRESGTYATFFCPRNPYIEGGKQHNLPFETVYGDESSDEFIICADYSQEFDRDKNVDDVAKEFYEPLIAFRHIFRIRDGKTFAEEFSGSAEQNREYVRRNRKYASARADAPFQIRLDSPVPKKEQNNNKSRDKARSTYYYKISDEEYRRVCSMNIRVLDAATRKETRDVRFEFGGDFEGVGVRNIDEVDYVLCGGNQEYYRMLTCQQPKEGEYIVQLIGLDVDYNPIQVCGSDEELIVMEYDISFLPTSAAAMLTESELYAQDSKFKKMRPDELEKAYGEPKVSIDFDQYMGLNDLDTNLRNKVLAGQQENDGLKQQYFKWPVPWESSNYGFGYDDGHDYNMYRLITHSTYATYKSAVENKHLPDSLGPIGLYDRKFYDSYRARKSDPNVPLEQGYYYFVNASADPGVMQRLSINDICQGATVHVSAWMAELTTGQSEVANISFNFVAVLKDDITVSDNSMIQPGDRVTLHSFISGYIPFITADSHGKRVSGGKTSAGNEGDYRGEWLYVYYSFVPQLSEFSSQGITADMVDHYELELDNNSKSSAGADYAIDDIRVYIVSPTVYASQHEPLCDATSTPIKVEVPFQTLIQSVGYKETIGDDPGDKVDMYYTFIDKEKFDAIYSSDNGAEAFEKSVVRFNYDSKDETVIDRMFGKVTFTTNYYKLDEYNYNKENPETGVAMRDIVDGERLVVFDSQLTDEDIHPGMQYYVLLKNTLAPDTDPDLDTAEKVWSFFDMMDKCAKKVVLTVQSSNVIKVDGQLAPDNNSFTVCENQSPVVQINISGMDENEETTTLIHNAYIDWFDGLLSEYLDYKDDNDNTLALAMETFRSIDTEASDLNEFNANGSTAFEDWMRDIIQRAIDEKKLFLRQSSYVFPPVSLKDGENEKECHVVAIPIPFDYDKEYTVCLNPTQVNIRVQNKAPLLSHGLTGIEYPALLTDVPLRIGIDQILHASAAADAYGDKGVVIPIRNVASSDNVTRAMSLKGEGTIILVQTNDPVYKDLGTIDDKGYETGSLLDIGIVVPDKFKAEIDGDDNQFVAVFDDDFTFREGYYYRMRFHYQEAADADSDHEVVCDGQDVFTLKIVPRFLRWTGEEGLNWNNDANWTRVDSKELATSEDRRKDEYNRYLTDGENNRKSAYAPLEFTSVIIPGDREAPYLYAPEFSSVGKWNDWTEKPSEIAGNYEDKVEGEELGNATEDIQYDMVAYPRVDRLTDDNNIYCRPWYVNTCRDIHFRPSAAIMNQQELHYEKAWVDFELDHSRWYTLSTPLKEVYAGDFYLPIDNARQETELFEPIVFDNTLEKNDRFKPAVFQRGWDKGMATVYEFDGGSRNVAVRTSWSHVYNDVEEIYGSGTGFSVKTDVSRMGDGKPGDGDKVLFRLPKADDTYKYYSLDGKTNVDHDATVSRENTHLLNDAKGTVSVRSRGSSSLFLVGNPFITDMDLARFIKHNVDKGTIKPNYWIVTADGQETGTITDDGAVGTAAPRVAPFQGFFVEAVNPVENLTLEYDESMMLRRHKTGDEPVGVRSHGDRMSALKVNAVTSGRRTSSALILDASDYGSDACDVMALDNRSLDVESVVYTVKSGRALAINFADSLNGTEIGVIADDDSETTLEFTGTEMAGKLYLYDRVDESYTPLSEGMTYNVTGAAVGRLYITDGADIDALPSGIQLVTDGNSVTVRDGAQSGTISLEVFDTLGHQVLAMTDDSSELTFTLPRGFYIVKVATAKEDTIAKIKI